MSANFNNLLFRYQNLTGNLILARGHKSDCGVGGRIDGEVTFSCKVHDLYCDDLMIVNNGKEVSVRKPPIPATFRERSSLA